jgi:hypothetical protein
LLAGRAVTRAIDQVAKDSKGIDLPKESWSAMETEEAQRSKILVVKLEQKTFPLSLGWRISRATNDIVRLMMGRPELCLDPVNARRKTGTSLDPGIEAIVENSCVKKRIISLLSAHL